MRQLDMNSTVTMKSTITTMIIMTIITIIMRNITQFTEMKKY